jgi:hypothetical protein
MEVTKVCCDCLKEKPLKSFRTCFSGRRTGNRVGYELRNPAGTVTNRCRSCYGLRERIRYQLEFYDAMGGKCECCGESDIRFLTLDHRNNDGNKHRETLQCYQIYRQARKEGYPRDRYAIHCWNCNCGRAHKGRGGACPHKSSESSEQAVSRMRQFIALVGRKFRKKESGKRPWKSAEMVGNGYAKRKLTRDMVEEIKRLKSTGVTQRSVAIQFGVDRRMIGMIWLGKRHKGAS